MRAVVSEIEDGFIVSISTLNEHEIELVAEETVKNLDLAETMIEQTAAKLKKGMNDVDLICNLSDGTILQVSQVAAIALINTEGKDAKALYVVLY